MWGEMELAGTEGRPLTRAAAPGTLTPRVCGVPQSSCARRVTDTGDLHSFSGHAVLFQLQSDGLQTRKQGSRAARTLPQAQEPSVLELGMEPHCHHPACLSGEAPLKSTSGSW